MAVMGVLWCNLVVYTAVKEVVFVERICNDQPYC